MSARRARLGAFATLAAIAAAGLLAETCGRQSPLTQLPNQRPRVTITSAPAPGSKIGNYSYELSWAGFDSDGFIDHFRYAVDAPRRPDAETAWVETKLNRQLFTFTADSLASDDAVFGQRFHTVDVEAIDDRGGISAPAAVAFNALTLAPTVRFKTPAPSPLLTAALAPSTRFTWEGSDPDGIENKLPRYYKWKLFGESSTPTLLDISLNPDTLLRMFAPRFADWDSLPGTATGVDVHDLLPGRTYVAAVVAFDVAGAYSVPMTFNANLVRFDVHQAAAVGPKLRLFTRAFDFTFPGGGFFDRVSDHLHAQVPANLPLTIEWTGTPSPGAIVTGYRWAMDLARVDDETPRSDEAADLSHWSRWGLDQQATLPANRLASGTVRSFYLEARDNSGNVSLGVIELSPVAAGLERDLLVVDDTRLLRDTRVGACVAAPRGQWPTAAELDTFLFAAGGVPWKCYPAGINSTPGILKGYRYDSLATYGISAETVTLAKLLHYRHILWIVNGGFQLNPGSNDQFPALRLLSAPGVLDPLFTWLAMGGKLWIMGGGVATATQLDYEVKFSPPDVFASSNGELGPGRFMYLAPHWRSEIRVNRTARAVRSARAVGGWAGAPDYSLLPPELDEKSEATDPMAPNRTNQSDFYRVNYIAEYLDKPNAILELDPADPTSQRQLSVVDTLYETLGGSAGSGWPVMTLYHGADSPVMVCSGFPVWYFQRPQAIELTDWVLQSLWGLSRKPVAR